MQSLISHFKSKGKVHQLVKGSPFSLKEEGKYYYLEGDPVHLAAPYFVKKYSGKLAFSGCDFSLSSEGQTTLYEVDTLDWALLEENDLLDWIQTLALCFEKQVPANVFKKKLSSDAPFSGNKGEVLEFSKEVVWVNAEGSFSISDRAALKKFSGVIPCVFPMWIEGQGEFKLTAIPFDQVDSKALQTFLTLVNQGLLHLQKERKSEDFRNLKNRALEQDKALNQAVEEVEDLFASKDTSSQGHNSLEKALQMLGKALKIEFTFPKGGDLFAICEASGVRVRKVILKEGWEKKYVGPLLCFQNKEPVAFLGKKQTFDLEAYMFYPTLPYKIQTGKGVFSYLVKEHVGLGFSLLFYGLLAGIISFLPAIATSLFFSFAVPLNDGALVGYLFLGLVFAACGYVIFSFLRNFCFLRFEAFFDHFLGTSLWDRLLKLSPHFFRKFSTGELFWKLMSVDDMRRILRENASYTMLNGLFAFLYLLIMAVYSPLMTVVSGLVALISLLVAAVLMRKKASLLAKEAEIQEALQGTMIQTVGGVAKLRTTQSEKNAFAHFLSQFTKTKNLQQKAQNVQNIASTLALTLPLFSMWIVYFVLIEVIGIKNLPLPAFLGFNIAFGSFTLAVYPLIETLVSLVGIVPFWNRAKVILQEEPEESKAKTFPGKLTGKIYIDEAFFSYDETPTLENVTIHAEPGEFIGIVGPTGCGKSTLFRLLLGFEEPTSGAVYYDDKDLAMLDVRGVRKQIGSVLQSSSLLGGTIYDNLVAGGSYSAEEIRYAVEAAGFIEDLRSFPMGLHTYVPSGGETLSGGQRQRLLLARALLGKPSILLLDEATSALDNRTQMHVTKNIEALGVTRVVIAQRLSTIEKADRIYVIDKGKIVQTGTFKELGNKPGIFQEMFERQKL